MYNHPIGNEDGLVAYWPVNPNGSNRNMVMQITNCIPPLYKQKDLKFKLSSPSSTKNLSTTFTA